MDAPIDFVAENIETMMSEDDDFICNEDVLASDNDVDDTPIDVVAAKCFLYHRWHHLADTAQAPAAGGRT